MGNILHHHCKYLLSETCVLSPVLITKQRGIPMYKTNVASALTGFIVFYLENVCIGQICTHTHTQACKHTQVCKHTHTIKLNGDKHTQNRKISKACCLHYK